MNSQSLPFYILSQDKTIPADAKGWSAYLDKDYWDDWSEYRTMFYLTIVDPEGNKHEIGQLKIGSRWLKPHASKPEAPPNHRYPAINEDGFTELEEGYFSVGQDDGYYLNLNKLADPIRERILIALRDVAWDTSLWNWAKNERVMKVSLLRSVTHSTVEGQFRRMAHGDARVTRYEFSYIPPKRLGDGAPPFELQFSVNPKSPIPTNVHILIGRNGVGKTRLLSLMTKALLAKDATANQSGKFEFSELGNERGKFANIVSVSFSAFDEAELLPDRSSSTDVLGFSFIGLRGLGDSPTASIKPKSLHMLATEFCNSLKECRIGARHRRWIEVISTLQSDPVFKAAQLTDMIDANLSEKEWLDSVYKTFKALSSGHKIVLLTLTRLVEKVEERTLVLIDEPEGHLHPPLLSAMTRAISELLVKRNGVAIVATHSPIILQEVPRSCVWIINRIQTSSKAERPTIETFGESVGILSREVFQLELSRSGYHQILNDIRREAETYEKAMELLDGQLGSEARAVLRAMYLSNTD